MPTNGTSVKPMPPDRRPQPSLWLDVQLGAGIDAMPIARPRLRRLALAALEGDASLTIRFVDIAEACELNHRYRGHDRATNVLTFVYDDTDRIQADIIVCPAVVRTEAAAQGKRTEDHLAHLVVHGVLHAQGYTHDQDADARHMEALEVAILRRFRIADPYVEQSR